MRQVTKPSNTGEKIRELTEEELQLVAGGRKAGADQQEHLVVTIKDIIVSG